MLIGAQVILLTLVTDPTTRLVPSSSSIWGKYAYIWQTHLVNAYDNLQKEYINRMDVKCQRIQIIIQYRNAVTLSSISTMSESVAVWWVVNRCHVSMRGISHIYMLYYVVMFPSVAGWFARVASHSRRLRMLPAWREPRAWQVLLQVLVPFCEACRSRPGPDTKLDEVQNRNTSQSSPTSLVWTASLTYSTILWFDNLTNLTTSIWFHMISIMMRNDQLAAPPCQVLLAECIGFRCHEQLWSPTSCQVPRVHMGTCTATKRLCRSRQLGKCWFISTSFEI